MQFEGQMTDRRGIRIVNLDFVEIDRVRRTDASERSRHAQSERENMADVLRHASRNYQRDSSRPASSAAPKAIADQSRSARPFAIAETNRSCSRLAVGIGALASEAF